MNTNTDARRAFRAGAEKAEAAAKEMAITRAADALERIADILDQVWTAKLRNEL